MYVNVQNFKPTRNNFFLTMLIVFGLSAAIIFNSETKDSLTLGNWLLIGGIIYSCVGLFVIYGSKYRDNFFGLSSCPHCNKKGWSIKEKLKISKNENTNLGRCSVCNKKASISVIHVFPLFGAFIAWFLVIFISDSISAACMAAYAWTIIYVLYFSRFATVNR